MCGTHAHCEEDKSCASIHSKSVRIQNSMTKSYYINQRGYKKPYLTQVPVLFAMVVL